MSATPLPTSTTESAHPPRRTWLARLLRQRTQPGEPEAESTAAPDRLPLVSLATRVGAIALVSGASASQATEMILRLGLAHGSGSRSTSPTRRSPWRAPSPTAGESR